jgi:hypothetical protein
LQPWARRADVGLVFLVAFLIWLLNHPYQGVWHDARIYALLAAQWLNPEPYARDLFFSFGSQAPFSLFTPLYGLLIASIGLDRAAWWITMSGGLLWIGACLALARTMLGSGFAARFAVFVGAVVAVSYSPNLSTFFIGESFATARSFAIPLGVLSVAALAATQRGWALGFGIAAAALHPLHGVWPLALWLLAGLRTPVALLVAFLPPAVALLLGVMNLDLPRVRLMTGEWLNFAWNLAPDISFKELSHTRMPYYAEVMVILWLAARMGSKEWRGLYSRLLMLGGCGLALALLASYAFPVEIVLQGQPWRVMALLIPMAAVALLDLGRCAWRSSAAGRLLVGVVAALAVMGSHWLLGAIAATALLSLLPNAWRELAEDWIGSRWRWFGAALAAFGLSTVPNILAAWEIFGGQMLNPWWTGAERLHGLIAGNNWHLAAIAALVVGWLLDHGRLTPQRAWPAFTTALLFAAGVLIAFSTLSAWDRRSDQFRVEQACYINPACAPHPFREWILPGDVVFWPQRELAVWFEIGTANYFGLVQETGRLFSAAKFYEGQRRKNRVAAGTDPRLLCADPLLDWVVVAQPAPALAMEASLPSAYLYRCAVLRSIPRTTSSSGLAS